MARNLTNTNTLYFLLFFFFCFTSSFIYSFIHNKFFFIHSINLWNFIITCIFLFIYLLNNIFYYCYVEEINIFCNFLITHHISFRFVFVLDILSNIDFLVYYSWKNCDKMLTNRIRYMNRIYSF